MLIQVKNKIFRTFQKYERLFKIYILRDRFLRAVTQWFADDGDNTLRIDYSLNSNSIVFDLGGYQGDFADKIYKKYKCKIYIFEPVESFYEKIQERFKGNENIYIYNFGLSDQNQTMFISLNSDGSSIYGHSATNEEIQLKDMVEVLEKEKISKIDLCKINIEGGEFDVLPKLIDTSWINKITDIQIQFHDFVANAKNMRKRIREDLSKTHVLTYDYWFVWENWKLKNK